VAVGAQRSETTRQQLLHEETSGVYVKRHGCALHGTGACCNTDYHAMLTMPVVDEGMAPSCGHANRARQHRSVVLVPIQLGESQALGKRVVQTVPIHSCY
jgi:hypothetical protein